MAVMFAGRIVEEGLARDIFANPAHPYTRALLDARPITNPSERIKIEKTEYSSGEGISERGCAYQPRCANKQPSCADFHGGLNKDGYACLYPLHHVKIEGQTVAD